MVRGIERLMRMNGPLECQQRLKLWKDCSSNKHGFWQQRMNLPTMKQKRKSFNNPGQRGAYQTHGRSTCNAQRAIFAWYHWRWRGKRWASREKGVDHVSIDVHQDTNSGFVPSSISGVVKPSKDGERLLWSDHLFVNNLLHYKTRVDQSWTIEAPAGIEIGLPRENRPLPRSRTSLNFHPGWHCSTFWSVSTRTKIVPSFRSIDSGGPLRKTTPACEAVLRRSFKLEFVNVESIEIGGIGWFTSV